MSEPVRQRPRGPYREHYYTQLEMDRAGKPFMLLAPQTIVLYGNDKRFRANVGGSLIVPLPKSSPCDLGFGYHLSPVDDDMLFGGHRFSLFASVTRNSWLQHIRAGVYGELGSMTSWKELQNDYSIGAEVAASISLVPASWRPHVDITLDFQAALDIQTLLGIRKKELVDSMIGGGLSLWWIL